MRFMQKRILSQLINIDKVAYKEVNFKSKLIEWSQKNRVNVDFTMLDESKDENGSPVFNHKIMIEGLEGCEGKGFSKKESQQLAAKFTLERLRKEPQFIDAVFAAKTLRTQQEEEPVLNVPDTDDKNDFIIPIEEQIIDEPQELEDVDVIADASLVEAENKPVSDNSEEFDLSDITAVPKEKNKEDIIAAAESAAFSDL